MASIGLQPKSVGHTDCSTCGGSIGTSNFDLFLAGSLEFSLTTVAFLFENCLGRMVKKRKKIVTASNQVLIIWRCEMLRDHENVYTIREMRE